MDDVGSGFHRRWMGLQSPEVFPGIMSWRNHWIWKATIRHLILTAKVWPWVCVGAFGTLGSAEQWTPRILILLGWPITSLFFSLPGIVIVALISRFREKPMPLVLWGFLIVCDYGCIMATINGALDPRKPFYVFEALDRGAPPS